MRLIDVDALIDEHYEACDKDKRKKFPSWSLRLMWEAPTIDAVPVRHGRWEVVDAEEPRRYGCSECRRLSWYMENYCHFCGAKMDEGEDNED